MPFKFTNKRLRITKITNKKKTTQLKMGKGLEWMFLQRIYTDDQQYTDHQHEMKFNNPNHQGNANENHNELASHTYLG